MSTRQFCDLPGSSPAFRGSGQTAVSALPSFLLGSLQPWDPLQAQRVFIHLLWFPCFKERLLDSCSFYVVKSLDVCSGEISLQTCQVSMFCVQICKRSINIHYRPFLSLNSQDIYKLSNTLWVGKYFFNSFLLLQFCSDSLYSSSVTMPISHFRLLFWQRITACDRSAKTKREKGGQSKTYIPGYCQNRTGAIQLFVMEYLAERASHWCHTARRSGK